MKILILSFYYPPDLSAGSFRTAALVRSLAAKVPEQATIDVWTTLPNRYASFTQAAPEIESDGPVQVRRFRLSSHRSGMFDQSRAFAGFARKIMSSLGSQKYDLVYATSSRLFTAWLGAHCARKMGARLYLDIRDIFTETMGDLLPGSAGRILAPVLNRIEASTITSADRVNLVSPGFLTYFRERYPKCEFSVFPNGIDSEFLEQHFSGGSTKRDRMQVLYAGNIGQGQGLHRIVPELAQRLQDTHEFLIVGDGGAREALENQLQASGIDNVELRSPVSRRNLIELYREADCLFLHLNDLAAFRRVLPSKIFEYAATGRPILAGVAGYPARFLESEMDNAAVFTPCDVEAGVRALRSLQPGYTDRSGFIEQYRRERIMEQMAEDVLSVI